MKHYFLRGFAILFTLFGAALLTSPAFAAPPFSVAIPTPNTAFINASVEISANFTNDTEDVDHCDLSVDGADQGAMFLDGDGSSGVANRDFAFTSTGSKTIRVTCYNSDESTAVWGEGVLVVFGDSADPFISAFSLTPSSPVSLTPTNILASYDDTDFGSGLQSCHLIVNSAVVAVMPLSGGVGSTAGTTDEDYTFPSGGSYTVEIQCSDRSGNVANRTEVISVTSAPDTQAPVVGNLSQSPSTVNIGTVVTFSTHVTDNVSVASCDLYKEGAFHSTMSFVGGNWEATWTAAEGTHWFYARCADTSGNTASSLDHYLTVTAGGGGSSDTTPPVVGNVTPTTATQNTARTFSATYSDGGTVSACRLYVQQPGGSYNNYSMSVPGGSSGSASYAYTFPGSVAPGNYNAYVTCTDDSGNTGTGPTASIALSGTSPGPGPGTSPYALRLVKLICPAGSIDVNHPCKAVYYVDSIGKRHAFPNEKVFFTWYTNFDSVVEVDAATLSSMTLGPNVNYRPGVRMVKFTTLNKVYAVGRYGLLRWVTTEAVATAMYGADWNTKIDDIADTFFGDYSFGAEISTAAAYSPSGETSAVSSIDANFR